MRADIQDQIVGIDRIQGLHAGLGVGQELLGNHDIGGQRNFCATRLGVGHDLVGGRDQVRLVQRLAHVVSGHSDKCIGNAAADDQLVDLVDQVGQQLQLGGDLAAGHDRQQGLGRVVQRLGQCVEFGHQQRAACCDRREADHAMRGGLRAVRGAEGIHHEHVAQRGVLARQRLVVLALADIHAAIFQQHHLARRDLHAVDPVAEQRHVHAQQCRQTRGHRRQ